MNSDYGILTSLEELVFEELSDFYYQWDQLRGDRIAPRSWEFDVLDFPDVLPSLTIFEVVDGGKDARIKFVGQSLIDRMKTGRAGKLITSVEHRPLRERMLKILHIVTETHKPAVSRPRIPLDTMTKTGTIQILALPLIDKGEVVEVVSVVASEPPAKPD